jgi:hypothetical protein
MRGTGYPRSKPFSVNASESEEALHLRTSPVVELLSDWAVEGYQSCIDRCCKRVMARLSNRYERVEPHGGELPIYYLDSPVHIRGMMWEVRLCRCMPDALTSARGSKCESRHTHPTFSLIMATSHIITAAPMPRKCIVSCISYHSIYPIKIFG